MGRLVEGKEAIEVGMALANRNEEMARRVGDSVMEALAEMRIALEETGRDRLRAAIADAIGPDDESEEELP